MQAEWNGEVKIVPGFEGPIHELILYTFVGTDCLRISISSSFNQRACSHLHVCQECRWKGDVQGPKGGWVVRTKTQAGNYMLVWVALYFQNQE